MNPEWQRRREIDRASKVRRRQYWRDKRTAVMRYHSDGRITVQLVAAYLPPEKHGKLQSAGYYGLLRLSMRSVCGGSCQIQPGQS